MPLLTTTNEVPVGARLHQAIRLGSGLLLPAGRVLNEADVDCLRGVRPEAPVFVEDPILDKLIDFEDDRADRWAARETGESLTGLLSAVHRRFATGNPLNEDHCRSLEKAVDETLAFLDQHPVKTAMRPEPRNDEHYLINHTAQVLYLSLVLGTNVQSLVAGSRDGPHSRGHASEIPRLHLTPLGLAALCMDAGMWSMEHLFRRSESLTAAQCEKVHNHPLISARMLPAELPEVVRIAVESHHENHDGTGYPRGLKGDEVHLFARILRIADAFAASTSTTPYRVACSPARALWEMNQVPFEQMFDPVLLKVFGRLVHPYPIGAKLQLSCGRYGVVASYGRGHSMYPQLVIAFDEHGRRLPEDELEGPVSLLEREDLTIVAHGGEDLSDIYSASPAYLEVSPSEVKALCESAQTCCAGVGGPTG